MNAKGAAIMLFIGSASAALAWTSLNSVQESPKSIEFQRAPAGFGKVSFASTAPTWPRTADTSVSAVQGAGCQSRSKFYPWGRMAVRTWTPVNAAVAAGTPGVYETSGTRTGAPFSARLIQAFGKDVGDSRQSVVLEMPDGCRRQFRSASFVASDVNVINAEIGRRPFPADPNSYATSIAQEGLVTEDQVRSAVVKTYETQHFNIMYGTKTGNFSYRHQAGLNVPWDKFINGVGKTFESAWQLDRYILEAPMPYLNSDNRKKINVYICGTGLPFIENGDNVGCGASAAAGIFVDAPSVQEGSTTVIHEFGHVIQFYTGGFRDKPSAGPIWETGAEWTSFTQSQTEEYFLVNYLSNLENGPLWSNVRYASFPFMSFLFEQDRTRPFLWSGWTGNLRTASGATTEDWTQTLVRQAQAAGIYPAGYASFADDMGWYAARLVPMDFLHQQALIDIRNSELAANVYTSLRSTSSGFYASSSGRPLRQWGSHIVPLSAGAEKVSVTVQGSTTAGSAAWRAMLVSVSADGTPRYSTMGKIVGTAAATVTLPAVQSEKMYLVVTATPYQYQSLGWQPEGKAITGSTFPYSVRIAGATPLTTPVSKCTSIISGGTGLNFNYNTNGRIDGGVPCK